MWSFVHKEQVQNSKMHPYIMLWQADCTFLVLPIIHTIALVTNPPLCVPVCFPKNHPCLFLSSPLRLATRQSPASIHPTCLLKCDRDAQPWPPRCMSPARVFFFEHAWQANGATLGKNRGDIHDHYDHGGVAELMSPLKRTIVLLLEGRDAKKRRKNKTNARWRETQGQMLDGTCT